MAIDEGGKVRFVGSEWIGMDNPPEFASWQEFNAIAMKAFTVMMRRGWSVIKASRGWSVACPDFAANPDVPRRMHMDECLEAADPFTALVKADKWYKENVEGEAKQGMPGHEQSNRPG